MSTPAISLGRSRLFLLSFASACLAGGITASAQEGVEKPDPAGTLQTQIESLAGELLKRVDTSETLQDAIANRKIDAEHDRAVLDNAEKTRTVAQIAVREYLDGTFLQEEQTIQSDIKLSQSEMERAKDRLGWSQRSLEKGTTDKSVVLNDRMNLQKAEISLANARTRLSVLRKYSKEKTVTELEAAVQKAEAGVSKAQTEYQDAANALENARRRLPTDGLTDGERRALVALDEAIQSLDEGKIEPATVKYQEAREAYDQEQARRVRERFTALKTRIHRAADEVR